MAIMQTNLPGVKLHGRGKVRDIYDLGEHFLIVATDRLSAFDVVLPTPIPNKGKVLNQMSAFWFDSLQGLRSQSRGVDTRRRLSRRALQHFEDQLEGRSMLVKKAKVFPDRMRGPRISYRFRSEGLQQNRQGLRHRSPGGTTGFRPSAGTDLYAGDEGRNRSRRKHFRRRGRPALLGQEHIRRLQGTDAFHLQPRRGVCGRSAALSSATRSSNLELIDGKIAIVDEMLTPDSSRFWPADQYCSGQAAAVVRQTVRSRLSGTDRLEQAAACSRASGRYRERDERQIRRGVENFDRTRTAVSFFRRA